MPQLEILRDDITLLVKTQGPRKGPTLLFLHADGDPLPMWSPVFSCLRPRHWQLATPDLGGRGESGLVRHYGFNDFLGDAYQIIQGLRGRPLVLVGSSIGGLKALLLTKQHPGLIDGLVLLDTPSHSSADMAKPGRATEGPGAAHVDTRVQMRPSSELALQEVLSDPLRLAKAAQSVSVPTLLLYGSDSERAGEEELHWWRRNIPHLETEKVDAEYPMARDNPQAVANKIAAFIPTLIPETIH